MRILHCCADIREWLKNGNDCSKCECCWEDWGAYHEDCDCGCHIKGYEYDTTRCYLIAPLRRLLMRRVRYFQNHEYDGYLQFTERQNTEREKCREAIAGMLNGCVICWKSADGTLHECNTEMIIIQESWTVQEALKPEYQPPLKITQRWKSLLHDTATVIPNAIKPFICK